MPQPCEGWSLAGICFSLDAHANGSEFVHRGNKGGNYPPSSPRIYNDMKVGIIGSGAMGAGIAQVAAMAGAAVVLHDLHRSALDKAQQGLAATLHKLEEKGKITSATETLGRIRFEAAADALAGCDWVIEAIVENLEIKKQVMAEAARIAGKDSLIATNTSSLSVTALAAACPHPERVMGIHFFNPAPLMSLVEIIPGLQTDAALLPGVAQTLQAWGKVPVTAKDTPGFIVNRVARPFYGEALRIVEEGLADMPTVDAAMRGLGFRMGPFELMDLIGNDVNYLVTESVYRSTYYDTRYRPSITQLRMTEAGWLGRKSGRGYYDYAAGATVAAPSANAQLLADTGQRILLMLINEACDALYHGIASETDLELAMTRGVNYPKGLIAWGRELGWQVCAAGIDKLYHHYREDRYRTSPGLLTFATA